MAQNNAVVVDWVKTTVPDGVYGTPYVGQDLTSYVTSTLNGNDVTDKDSYTFTLSAADTANGWYIDTTDHHTLKNDDIPVVGAVTLTATVTSANSGNTKTQALALTVNPNTNIDVTWTGETLPGGNYGEAYSPDTQVDLTAYVKSTLNGNDITDQDTYTFTLDSQKGSTNNDWAVSSAGIVTNTNGTVRDVGPVQLNVTVTSANSGKSVSTPTSSR